MSRRWLLLVAVLVFAPVVRAAEPAVCHLVGRVTDEQGEPVAGTLVRVMIGPSLLGDEKRMRTGTSDKEGNYSVALPPGHARLLNVDPTAGYFVDSFRMTDFATSRQQPIHNIDFVLERGTSCTLDLSQLDRSPTFMIYTSGRDRNKKAFTHTARAAATVEAGITLPPRGGQFSSVVFDASRKPVCAVLIDVEDQFSPDQIETISPPDKSRFEVFDADGHKATISRATPLAVDGKLTLRPTPIDLNPAQQDTTRIVGRVVDEQGEPLAEATIQLGLADKSSSSMAGYTTTSGDDGTFALEIPTHWAAAKPERSFFLVVIRQGTGGKETDKQPLTADTKRIEVPPIRLAAGHKLRVRVVDEAGHPLEGAWVQAGGTFLSSENFSRTDREGRVEIADLPAGTVNVMASYGSLTKYERVVIDAEASDDETTLQLVAPQPVAQRDPIPDPPPIGSPAPELSIVGWTDGQTRKLADYRGKVVVLDFWGVWCSACLNSIPSAKEVAKTYAGNPDVVFLGIHSADTEMSQVKKLLKVKDWQLVTGVDEGSDKAGGPTARAYGVRGWPTFVVIDRQGKIAHNSNLEKWNPVTIALEHARICNELKISPPKGDAPIEEKTEYLNKVNTYRSCELIDRALEQK